MFEKQAEVEVSTDVVGRPVQEFGRRRVPRGELRQQANINIDINTNEHDELNCGKTFGYYKL